MDWTRKLISICFTYHLIILGVGSQPDGSHYNNRLWVTRIRSSNASEVVQLAKRNGFRFQKQVTGFPDTYIFESILPAPASHYLSWKRTPGHVLDQEDNVEWAVQQQELRRVKRDFIYVDYEDATPDAPINYRLPLNMDSTNEIFSYEDTDATRPNGHRSPLFNDEMWNQQWYMHDTRSSASGLPKLDLNVLPVYGRGITGNGVRVVVLDDGLEFEHEDLLQNYDSEISYNCNLDTADARPNYSSKHNSHGTRCAGEIAMLADNKKCGVGIAFNARIGGIKLLDGVVTDLIEGMALGYAYDKVDIYSSSWGPNDNGNSLEKPGILAEDAIRRGIRDGRQGKGSIYVWASGNGGRHMDNCNCDGYAASIYTITVGSVNQRGDLPWYGELCPAILTVTYSSGAYTDQMITTTDLHNECTNQHSGTSASAPLAAAIIALGLEANPNTTWRDIQYLIVNTAEYTPLMHNDGWQMNAAGYWFNIRFGFGLMNADSYVNMAANWINVGPQSSVELEYPENYLPLQNIPGSPLTKLTFDYTEESIKFLEHVEVIIDLDYELYRGFLEFYLISPQKTRVQLLGQRPNDKSRLGFKDWSLMSVATWSENPSGNWTLEIIDTASKRTNRGTLNKAVLRLWGTEVLPEIRTNGPRKYNGNYVRDIFL